MPARAGSLLATRRGKLLLLLLCAVQFPDVADLSIMNVTLASIRRDRGFSVQGLRRVLSGYLVTYGALLPPGGRAGNLLGQRPLLAAASARLRVSARSHAPGGSDQRPRHRPRRLERWRRPSRPVHLARA